MLITLFMKRFYQFFDLRFTAVVSILYLLLIFFFKDLKIPFRKLYTY